MKTLPLTTDRLILRDFVPDDWREVHTYARDPAVVMYMPWGPNTEKDTKQFIRRALGYRNEDPRTHFELAIVLAEANRLIGGCGVRLTSPTSSVASMGYCLNRELWGQGYATEAARAVLAFGFEELRPHRVFATCDPDNIASARVLEKLGMKREGRLREDVWIRDRWRDSLVYAIIEREWRDTKSPATDG